MLHLQKRTRGDTIVEVLLCITILALLFTGAYGLSSHSLAEGITASEHTQAIKLAQSQIEALNIRQQKSSSTDWTTNFGQAGLNFCLDSTATDPAQPSWNPITQMTSKNPANLTVNASSDTNYKVGCVVPPSVNGAKYYINVSTPESATPIPDSTYLVTVRWIRIGSNDQNLSQIYFRLPNSTASIPVAPGGGGGGGGGECIIDNRCFGRGGGGGGGGFIGSNNPASPEYIPGWIEPEPQASGGGSCGYDVCY